MNFRWRTASIGNGDHGPTLSVDNFVVKKDGLPIVAAPRAELSLDLNSLLIGRVKLRRLEVLDLDLRLSVDRDGAVAISAGAHPVPAQAPRIAARQRRGRSARRCGATLPGRCGR